MNNQNSYSLSGRIGAQRIAPRTIPIYAPSRVEARERIRIRAQRRQTVFVPRWLVFLVLMMLTFAFCAALNVKTGAKMNVEMQQQTVLQHEIENLQTGNQALADEVSSLASDSAAIQRAARQRLGMILPSERILVPAR